MRGCRSSQCPDGTSERPAVISFDPGHAPVSGPRESAILAQTINWEAVKTWVRQKRIVCFAVSPEDTYALVDMIQSRVGFNLMLSITEPGTVVIARPSVLNARIADRLME